MNITDLQTIQSNLVDAIKDLSANPKPSYSIDGQTVSWDQHYQSLWAQLEKVNEKINQAQPYEIHSQGFT